MGWKNFWTAAIALVALASWSAALQAGSGTCAHCGLHKPCDPQCRLVKEMKEVEITCWDTVKEKVCFGGPCQMGEGHCEPACTDAKKGGGCGPCGLGGHKKFAWVETIPSDCPRSFVRKKLIRQTVTKTIPVYRWVVEEVCKDCAGKMKPVEVPREAQVPPPPILPDLHGSTRRVSDQPDTVQTGNHASPAPKATPSLRVRLTSLLP